MAQTSPAVLGPVEPSVRPRFEQTYCSQCGGEFGAGNSGFSHCTDHMERQSMSGDIAPRGQATNPRPERVAAVTLSGCEFVVGWDGEPADYEWHYYLGGLGQQKPSAWVECVKLGGKWWDVSEVFAPDFCAQLDAALMSLEEFGACKA